MRSLKKVNTLVLTLAVLLAVGCGNEENNNDPAPESQTQKTCLLTRQVGPVTTSDFLYNSAGQVIRVNNLRQNPADNYHMEITYNAAGNIDKVTYFDSNNVQDMLQVYSYNAQNLPDTIYTIHNSQVGNFNTYEYNAAGQLIKLNIFDGGATTAMGFTEITYPATNQSKELTYHRDALGNIVLNATHLKQYDSKKHPHSHFKSLFGPMLSKNNLLTVNSAYHVQGTSLSYTNTYIYNADGYPTQQTITSSQPSSQPTTIYFTYNCQ